MGAGEAMAFTVAVSHSLSLSLPLSPTLSFMHAPIQANNPKYTYVPTRSFIHTPINTSTHTCPLTIFISFSLSRKKAFVLTSLSCFLGWLGWFNRHRYNFFVSLSLSTLWLELWSWCVSEERLNKFSSQMIALSDIKEVDWAYSWSYHKWALVVAQLAERLLLTPEIRGLNPNIGKVLYTNCY